MPTEIRVPRIGHSMTEATVVEWHFTAGAPVRAGEVVATIESDKAEYEIESPADGVLSELAFAAGDTAEVGAVLAYVLAQGEKAPAMAAPARPPHAAEPAPEPPRAGAVRVKASPKARQLAAKKGIDLHGVSATGPGGLITEKDVEAAARAPDRGSPPSAGERVRLSAVQRAGARRLTATWTSVPHFVQLVDADVGSLEDRRREWKADGGELARVTLTDFIVRATAFALREHRMVNASFDGDELVVHTAVNAGVAMETPAGLVVPVIRDADRLSLAEITRRRIELAERARAGKLGPEETSGGTFSVSNLGAFGIRAGFPILNAPEALLVFVGAVEERPVVRDGRITSRTLVTLSIAYDHRVVDGAAAARVSGRIRDLLESAEALGAGDAPA